MDNEPNFRTYPKKPTTPSDGGATTSSDSVPLKVYPKRPADAAPNPNWSKLFAVGNPMDWMRVAGSNLGGDVLMAHLATGDYVAPQEEAYAKNLAAEHAKTEAAQNRLPPFGNFTANAAGFAPYSMLGGPISEGLGPAFNYGAPLTRKLLGQVAANTIGGATATAARGEDPVKGAIAGGVTGLVGAPLGGVANWTVNKAATPIGRATGLLSTPEKVATDTAAKSAGEYSSANQFEFNPLDVNGVRSSTYGTFTPAEQANFSSGMKTKFNDHTASINSSGQVNAGDIDTYGRGLFNAVRNPFDKMLASRLKDNLDDFMGRGTPTSGQPVGQALLQIEQARQAGQQAIMGEQLPQVIQKVQRGFNPSAWADAQSEFYDPNSQNAADLSAISRKAGGSGALPSGYGMSHTAGDVAEVAAGLAGMPDAGLVTGAGVQLLKAPLTGMMKGIKQKSLIGDLYGLYPGTTGQSVASNTQIPGMMVNAGLGGQAASGYYPPSFPFGQQDQNQ